MKLQILVELGAEERQAIALCAGGRELASPKMCEQFIYASIESQLEAVLNDVDPHEVLSAREEA